MRGSRVKGLGHAGNRMAQGPGLERRCAVEAIGRLINQSPGCRQGTILAPVAAWQPLPGSGAVSALGHFQVILERRRDLGVARGT
jgi:hypothetical protein